MDRGRALIQKMIEHNIGEHGENFNDFLQKIGYTDQNKITFWKDLIEELQFEQGTGDGKGVPRSDISVKHPYPIRQEDTEFENSLFNIISNLCDLPAEQEQGEELLLSNLYKLLEEDDTKQFWNESVQEILNKIKKLKNPEANPTLISIDGENDLTLNDIKEADAGANYNSQGTNSPPVHPFINVDGETFDEVRGTDQIKLYSQYLDKLDFTNDHTDWITLIMPNYGRGTKIEDLNRNFWVIAEAIDGISSWVMDGSPLQELLKKFLNEITQLWENCIYLWMQIALMNQKKSESIFVFSDVIKVPDYECLTHYDNIPKITCRVQNNNFIINEEIIYNLDNTIKGKLGSIKNYSQNYSQSVLGFLPVYRTNNYRYNYYSAEYYKNFYVLNSNKINNNGTFVYEGYSLVEFYEDNKERPIIISPRYEIDSRFSNKIFASRFDNNNKYYYSYPFTKIEQIDYEEPFLLYGCLKIVPNIQFTLSDIKGINIENFELAVYDAAAPMVLGVERELGKFIFKDIDNNIKKIRLQYIPANFEQEDILTLQTKYCNEISNSYYLGDVASWKNRIPIKWD